MGVYEDQRSIDMARLGQSHHLPVVILLYSASAGESRASKRMSGILLDPEPEQGQPQSA